MKVLSWIARLGALAFLAAALVASARPDPVAPARGTTYLLNVSASVPLEAVAEQIETVRREARGSVAVIAYAANAEVLVAPRRGVPEIPLERGKAPWLASIDRFGADVREAIDLARVVAPTFDIVLFTDGHAAELPGDVEIRPVRYTWEGDVMARGLEAPAVIELARPFDARLRVDAAAAAKAVAILTANDVEVARQAVDLQVGAQVVRFRNLEGRAKGLMVLRGFVHVEGDPRPANNFSAACVSVLGPSRVLLLEGRRGDAASVAAILKAQDLEIIVEPLARLEAYAGALGDVDAIVLSASDGAQIGERELGLLEQAVRSGAGFFFLSRRENEKAGIPERLTAMLPVTWKPAPTKPPPPKPTPKPPTPKPPTPVPRPVTVEAPPIALLVLVDKSGSMTGENLALAKEACLASAETLAPTDAIGVIGFDDRPQWVCPFVFAADSRSIEDRVSRMTAGGNTNIFGAVAAGVEALVRRPEPVRHVILLSDGITAPAVWDELFDIARDEKITVTSVCVGMGWPPNVQLMNSIATRTGGRFIYSESFKNVPQIFTRETRRVVKDAKPPEPGPKPVEPPPPPPPDPEPEPPKPPEEKQPEPGPRAVVKGDPHDATKGVEAFPNVGGLLASEARPGAVTILKAGGDPLLVAGRYGLGRTAAWTSDLGDRWCAEWNGAPAASKVVTQLVRHLASSARDSVPQVTVRESHFAIEGWEGATAKVVAPVETDLSSGDVPIDRFDEPYRVMISRGDASLLIGLIRSYPAEIGWRSHHESMFKTTPKRPAPPEPGPRPDWRPWLVVSAAVLVLVDVALRRAAA